MIEGENGRIRVNRNGLTGKPVEDIDADPKAREEIEGMMLEIYGGPVPGGGAPHMQNFFDCIQNGKQPVANVPDHVRAVNACHLANIALLAGRKVVYDPAAGNFGDDAVANGLIRRKRRGNTTSRCEEGLTVLQGQWLETVRVARFAAETACRRGPSNHGGKPCEPRCGRLYNGTVCSTRHGLER